VEIVAPDFFDVNAVTFPESTQRIGSWCAIPHSFRPAVD
jgi:hypothetical protein